MVDYGFVDSFMEKVRREGRERRLSRVTRQDDGTVIIDGREYVDFCSNDYLGLSFRTELKDAAVDAISLYGCGSGASRLMSGNLSVQESLEDEVARLKGKACALVTGSGYLANIGVIPALAGRHDVVFSDRLNHASIVDGIRLSGAKMIRFHHNDMSHLEELLLKNRKEFNRAVIVVESIYSMDGDIAPIDETIDLARRFDALVVVDEAHAVGVYGECGEGIVTHEQAQEIDCIIGTFGKAFGGYGAFVAMDDRLKTYMLHRCRTFIFSTALPPAVVAANIEGVRLAREAKELRARLFANIATFRNAIEEKTGKVMPGVSQIVPVITGSNETAVKLERVLLENGFFAKAIRPPTVPQGSARIRFSVTAMHSHEQLVDVAAVVADFMSSPDII